MFLDLYFPIFPEDVVSGVRETFVITYNGEYSTNGVPEECEGVVDAQMSQCTKEWECKCQDAANNTYFCVRKLNNHENTLYCQFDDEESFVEAYDLSTDPYQLLNLVKMNDTTQSQKITSSLEKFRSIIEDSPLNTKHSDTMFIYESMVQYVKRAWILLIKYFNI